MNEMNDLGDILAPAGLQRRWSYFLTSYGAQISYIEVGFRGRWSIRWVSYDGSSNCALPRLDRIPLHAASGARKGQCVDGGNGGHRGHLGGGKGPRSKEPTTYRGSTKPTEHQASG